MLLYICTTSSFHLYMEYKKWEQNQNRVTHIENKLMVTRGSSLGREMSWEIGIDKYTLLDIKQTANKNLLCSTGNSTQYSVMTYMGKESK